MRHLVALLFLVTSLFSVNEAEASHYAAGELYYDYISPMVYKVHLKIYRDCTGAGLSTTDQVCVGSNSQAVSYSFTVDTAGANDPKNGKAISQVCPTIPTTCSVPAGTIIAYTYYHYVATVDLTNDAGGGPATDWQFTYNTCCRNAAVLNLNPNQGSFGLIARLNNIAKPTNSSIRFLAEPIPYICDTFQQTYQNQPYDPDGDSIYVVAVPAIQTVDCQTGVPTNFNYFTINPPQAVPAFVTSAQKPFPILPATNYVVNPATGAATFNPAAIPAGGKLSYVLAFEAQEYDKLTGIKIGTVERDAQIYIFDCANVTPPIIPDTNAQVFCNLIPNAKGEYEMCPGENIIITAKTKKGGSVNPSNVIFATTDAKVTLGPSAIVTTQYPLGSIDSNSCTVSWIPGANYGTFNLNFNFADSSCLISGSGQPIVLVNSVNVVIRVLQGLSAGGPYNYCPGTNAVQLSATAPATTTGFVWTNITPGTNANFSDPNIANPTINPSATMSLVVTGLPPIASGCPNADTVDVTVWPAVTVTSVPSKQFPCANEPITLNTTVTPASPNYTFLWSSNTFFNPSSSINTQSPAVTPLAPNSYTLTVTNVINGCVDTTVVGYTTIGIKPIMAPYPARAKVCPGEQLQLFSNSAPQPCGISANQCKGASSFKTVGSANIINGAFSPFYRDFSQLYRAQYLILAGELKAAGINAGNIQGLNLKIGSNINNPISDTMTNFRVKMGCTSLSSLSSTTGYVTGLTQVFQSSKFSPNTTLTEMLFPSASTYFWDGKSNLVIEFCYSLPNTTGATPTPVFSSGTPFTSVLRDDTWSGGAPNSCVIAASATTSQMGSVRPNFGFLYCNSNDFTYTWTPASAFINNKSENPFTSPSGVGQNGGTYTVVVFSDTSLCSATGTVTVTTDLTGGITAATSDTFICEPGLQTLTGTPTAGTVPPVYSCGETAIPNGATTLSTIGTGTNISPISPFNFYDGNRLQWIITAAELKATLGGSGNPRRIDSIAINISSKTSIDPFENFNISMECTNLPTLVGGFANVGNAPIFSTPAYNTVVGWNYFKLTPGFLWDGVSNVVINLCNYSTFGGATDQIQTSITTAPNMQFMHSGYNGTGCAMPDGSSFTPWNFAFTERPNTRIYSKPVQPKPFQYVWRPSLFVNDTTKGVTTAYVAATTVYTVAVVNATGCLKTSTAKITLIEHDVTVRPNDTILCKDDKFIAYGTGSGTGLSPVYSWIPTGPTSGVNSPNSISTILTPPANTIYSLIRVDEFGCRDTANVDAQLYPNVPTTITNGDSLVVFYQDPITLSAINGQQFAWWPSFGLTTPSLASTDLSATQSDLYHVYSIDSNGCYGYDSVYVTVITENPLVLPQVFTPNGDKDNDVFRIVNLGVNKIQEFRVFSRWGTEVFSGRNNDGWDGSFKGKDMDMDTYTYFIKLANPNGKVQNLKGDFLLMR